METIETVVLRRGSVVSRERKGERVDTNGRRGRRFGELDRFRQGEDRG